VAYDCVIELPSGMMRVAVVEKSGFPGRWVGLRPENGLPGNAQGQQNGAQQARKKGGGKRGGKHEHKGLVSGAIRPVGLPVVAKAGGAREDGKKWLPECNNLSVVTGMMSRGWEYQFATPDG
jgi:hypothetical protein